MKHIDLINHFNLVEQSIRQGDPRFEVVDNEHIKDVKTGLKYHLYSDWRNMPYKITMGDDIVLLGSQLTQNEAAKLSNIKKILDHHFGVINRAKFNEIMSAKVEPEIEQVSLNIAKPKK
jgi:hypothetical protein